MQTSGEHQVLDAELVRAQYSPATTYLNTASSGLLPARAGAAMRAAIADMSQGRSPDSLFADIEAARAAFARIAGVPVERVATGGSVAVYTGLIAASLPAGAEVLTAEGDFSSTVNPFHVRADLKVRAVPLDALPDAVRLLSVTGVLAVAVALLTAGVPVTAVCLLRVVLPLAAVGSLAVSGLLPPSLVPVVRVRGMPRFGALAPAILSHRSPTSREAGVRRCPIRMARPGRATVPPLDAVRRLFEHRRSRGTLPYRDQTTTSTPSPGAVPDARSDSSACWRMMTAAAWSMTERPFLDLTPLARSP